MSIVVGTGAALSLIAGGAMCGIFLAFSLSVVPGLNALPPARAAEAMRAANRAILNPLFMMLFFGAWLAPAATGVGLLSTGNTSASYALLLAAGLYLAGAFLPTIAVNVPLNQALDAASDDAAAWQAFSGRWLRWNHLRALACVLSLLALGWGIASW